VNFSRSQDRVARPSRQGGRVAQRQEAAPWGLGLLCRVISQIRRWCLRLGQAAKAARERWFDADGAASCRFATRPVLRTRQGHPISPRGAW